MERSLCSINSFIIGYWIKNGAGFLSSLNYLAYVTNKKRIRLRILYIIFGIFLYLACFK